MRSCQLLLDLRRGPVLPQRTRYDAITCDYPNATNDDSRTNTRNRQIVIKTKRSAVTAPGVGLVS